MVSTPIKRYRVGTESYKKWCVLRSKMAVCEIHMHGSLFSSERARILTRPGVHTNIYIPHKYTINIHNQSYIINSTGIFFSVHILQNITVGKKGSVFNYCIFFLGKDIEYTIFSFEHQSRLISMNQIIYILRFLKYRALHLVLSLRLVIF